MLMDKTLIYALIVLFIGLTVFVLITWSNTRAARQHIKEIFQQQKLIKTNPDVHRLSQAVHLLHPSARLGFDYLIKQENGELPTLAAWNTAGTMPTQAELDEALREVTAIDSRGYAAMRRSEYPGIEDQLDAAYKARRGDPTEQEELDARIEQIKNKYPKSDEEL
jgi:hypothetical protein